MLHDLDLELAEYFEFKVKGFKYRFKHLNTGEIQEMQALSGDEEKTKEYLFTFIESVDNAPSFKEIANKMIAPQWVKFRDMIKAEFGG